MQPIQDLIWGGITPLNKYAAFIANIIMVGYVGIVLISLLILWGFVYLISHMENFIE
jgi:hypothetical protein